MTFSAGQIIGMLKYAAIIGGVAFIYFQIKSLGELEEKVDVQAKEISRLESERDAMANSLVIIQKERSDYEKKIKSFGMENRMLREKIREVERDAEDGDCLVSSIDPDVAGWVLKGACGLYLSSREGECGDDRQAGAENIR